MVIHYDAVPLGPLQQSTPCAVKPLPRGLHFQTQKNALLAILLFRQISLVFLIFWVLVKEEALKLVALYYTEFSSNI